MKGRSDRRSPREATRSPPEPLPGEGWWEALVRAAAVLPDGVVVTDAEGRIVHVNPELEGMSGYRLPELLGEPVEVLVPEAARELHRRERRAYAASPRVRPMAAGRDLQLRRRDGSRLPVDISLAPLRIAEGLLVLAAVRDASERRLADAERRRLAAELVRAGEAERIRMAADVHDGPIQKLTALVLRMELLTRSAADPALAARLAGLTEEAREVIRTLRRVVYEAHPPTLDRQGLVAAVREYLREAATCHGFRVEVEDSLTEEPLPEARTTFFRLSQESVANVVKHAAARRVEVRVASRDEGVWGMVRDDGAGFRAEEAAAPKEGTPPGTRAGIELMRRRAELFGGWLRVRSAPGSGTTVEWWLPREAAASAAIDT